MVETAPAAPFVIAKAKLLLELLIIALDPPAQFGDVDQLIKGNILEHDGKPIFRRLGFALRPLDQQPFFRAWLGQLGVAMPHGSSPWAKGPRSHPLPCEARSEPVGAALAPRNGVPCSCRQAESEGLDRERLMLPVAPQQLGWSSATAAMLRWQRSRPWRPHRGVGTDTRHIAQAKSSDFRSQPSVVAVAGIHQHHTLGQPRRLRRADLPKGDLGLGLKSNCFWHMGLVSPGPILGPVLGEPAWAQARCVVSLASPSTLVA